MALVLTIVGVVAVMVVAFMVAILRSLRGDKALAQATARLEAVAAEERQRQALIDAAMPRIERGAATLATVARGRGVARDVGPTADDVIMHMVTSDEKGENGLWLH